MKMTKQATTMMTKKLLVLELGWEVDLKIPRNSM
jgi:hypothetical protein